MREERKEDEKRQELSTSDVFHRASFSEPTRRKSSILVKPMRFLRLISILR